MNRLHDRRFVRLALIGALAAAFGLAACGRKGDLDPPPSANLTGEHQTANSMGNPIVAPIGSQPSSGSASQQAVKGPKKHIILDDLLN